MLDPEAVFRADAAAMKLGGAETRGASAVAKYFQGKAQGARPALMYGRIGAAVFDRRRLLLALRVTIDGGRTASIEASADPERIGQLDVTVLGS